MDRTAATAGDPARALLMKRIDARLLVTMGLLLFAGSCFMNLYLDRDYGAPQLFWPNVIRAFGQAIVMTPISAIAMVGITAAEAGAASGLFNMMRNLGGAIGTAAIETFFTKREQFHSAIINAHVSLLEPATRSRLAELQQYFMSHGFPDQRGRCTAPSSPSATSSASRRRSWATPTASPCSGSSSSSRFSRSRCSERVPLPAAPRTEFERERDGVLPYLCLCGVRSLFGDTPEGWVHNRFSVGAKGWEGSRPTTTRWRELSNLPR